jgi:hypothetical protein
MSISYCVLLATVIELLLDLFMCKFYRGGNWVMLLLMLIRGCVSYGGQIVALRLCEQIVQEHEVCVQLQGCMYRYL